MKVGLLGPPERDEIRRLAIRLEERGAEPVPLDAREEPRFHVEGDRVEALGVDLAGLAGLYVADLAVRPPWRRGRDGKADLPASRRAVAASRRRLAAWNTVLELLVRRGVRVVNPPRAHDLHALKPREIAASERAGIPVPRTIATSDPEVLAGLDDLPAGWITKGMVGGYGYTEAFDRPSTAAGAREALAAGPLMVQERVVGADVRVFVVGGRVVAAAEIDARDPVDSRRGTTRVRGIDVPAEAARIAREAAALWEMPFCAVDFLREEGTGRWVLLECNSSPFFVAFERRAGRDVAGPLADLLCGRGRFVEGTR